MRQRSMDSLQIIHNMLEQDPGRRLLAVAAEEQVGVLVRVPHSSGLLEGKFTEETTFPPGDHRSHRPREGLIDGLKKLEQLRFLHEGTPPRRGGSGDGRPPGPAAPPWRRP